MMLLSFRTATDIVVSGSRDHLRHAAMRKQESVRQQGDELLNYTDIIVNDLRLQEYLYIIIQLGASREALESYYDRQFSSLPTDAHVIVSRDGEALYGEKHKGLVDALRDRKGASTRGKFLFLSPDGPVMVAMQPLLYQGENLATSAVARLLGNEWLQSQESNSDDYLIFFEGDGRVLWSSNPDYRGFLVDRADKILVDAERSFYLHEVDMHTAGDDVPRLWFAASETRLLHMLNRYRNWAYAFSLLGGLTVLLLGWLMVRNFRRTFAQLMETTEAMVHGRLPVLDRSESRTELGQLLNRFADVLDALRREKAKVKRAHRKLQETAITDSLTGMHNRRYLQEVAPGLFAQVERDGRYLTGILLDLDYFKAINDKHGHLGGDAVLIHFARLLKHNSRANDHLFRIGGEEFLILNVAENPGGSVALAEKLRELVSRSPATYQGVSIAMTVSAGISCCSGRSGEGSLSRLMRSADKALYEAKASGRNRIVVHSSCEEACTKARGQTQKQSLSLVGDTKKLP
jgi:diguanylate cyclase (GGDEF)-like protein